MLLRLNVPPATACLLTPRQLVAAGRALATEAPRAGSTGALEDAQQDNKHAAQPVTVWSEGRSELGPPSLPFSEQSVSHAEKVLRSLLHRCRVCIVSSLSAPPRTQRQAALLFKGCTLP